MSTFDDDQDVQHILDDRLLDGHAVTGEPELEAVLTTLRSLGSGPAPAPRADLAALMRGGHSSSVTAPADAGTAAGDAVVVPLAGRSRRAVRYVAGLGLAAKLTLGAGVAAASVTGAATIDAVPDVIQRPAGVVVSGLVDLVTGGDTRDPEGGPGEGTSDEPGVDVPGAEVPEVDGPRPDEPRVGTPSVTPTPDTTDGPGRSDDGTGLERDLPDEADDAAEKAREEARARAERAQRDAQERAEQAQRDAEERAEEARERAEERRSGGAENAPDEPSGRSTQDPGGSGSAGTGADEPGQGGTKGKGQ